MRSTFAPVGLALAALIAALVRWWVQGSGNVYSAVAKRFYIPDADLGWRVSVQHPIWLGLEVCAVIAAIVLGLTVAGWIVRLREARRARRATILRVAMWLVAVIPSAVPIAAFASGPGPVGGRDTLPAAAAVAVETGIAGALHAPSGRYEVIAHEGSSITAHLSAGHEAFDARFTGELAGWWQGDPAHLESGSTASVSVAAVSVDTGIGERSAHARDAYLRAARYPQITFALTELVAARQDGADAIAFRGRGQLALIGKMHVVEITGLLRVPDAGALGRLGLSGDVLLVQADFSVPIHETALAPDAGDFDGDQIPIHVSLVLRHTGG